MLRAGVSDAHSQFNKLAPAAQGHHTAAARFDRVREVHSNTFGADVYAATGESLIGYRELGRKVNRETGMSVLKPVHS
jgi:hypothetical protein